LSLGQIAQREGGGGGREIARQTGIAGSLRRGKVVEPILESPQLGLGELLDPFCQLFELGSGIEGT
jgi:hypothetical protein